MKDILQGENRFVDLPGVYLGGPRHPGLRVPKYPAFCIVLTRMERGLLAIAHLSEAAMLSILRRLFSRKGSPARPVSPDVDTGVRLQYSRLEPRIVLDASFSFAGGLLTLNGFDGVGEGLSISEGGGNTYLFTLTTGTWSGVDGLAVSGDTLQVLTADRAQVLGLQILDNLGNDFDIQFTTDVNFSPLSQDLNGDLIAGGDLFIDGVGAISQTAGSSVTVENFHVIADSITLNDADNDFDSLQLTVADASLTDTDDVLLLDINATNNFSLTADGSITDDANTQIAVTNNLTLLGDSIVLADNGVNQLGVGGLASFSAGSITIDTAGTVNFLQLQVNSAGNVAITEDSDTEFSGANTADNLTVLSAGSIRDAVGTQFTITGDADFSAADEIVLSDNGTDALDVGGTATFRADDADISVGVASTFSPYDSNLNQGNPDSGATVNFGDLSFDSADAGDTSRGEVQIKEDSSTTLTTVARARSIYLGTEGGFTEAQWSEIDLANPAGGVTNLFVDALNAVVLANTGDSPVAVDGLAFFRSRNSTVDVGVNTGTGADSGVAVTLGNLAFQSPGQVRITVDSAVQLDCASTAGTLALNVNGALTDTAVATLVVSGDGVVAASGALTLADNAMNAFTINGAATLSGSSIALGSAGAANFASLNFNSPGDVAIQESSNTLLFGANTANNLQLGSDGFIRDDVGTTIAVAVDAALAATTDLTLANSAGDVLDVAGAATTSGSAIALGTVGIANFGAVRFNSAGAVNIREASDLQVFGANTAASLVLNSTGAIGDDVATTVAVTGNATLTATGAVTLADNAGDNWGIGGDAQLGGSVIAMGLVGEANFGTLQFNSTGDVTVQENSATTLSGANSANNLNLQSAGAIDDQAGTGVNVAVNGTWTAAGPITLADQAGDTLVVGGNAAFVAPGQDISVGVASAFSPFICGMNQGNPDSGATVNFGTLSFDAANAGDTARGEVQIKEDSATTLAGVARARSLYLGTEGGFDEVLWSGIDLANPAGGDTNLFVDAANAVVLADTGGSAVNVSGLAIFRSRTSTVDIGVDSGTGLDSGVAVNLGRLAFQSPAQVRVTTDSGTILDCASTAGTLILNVGGSLSDTDDGSVVVTGNGTIQAVGSIALGDAATNQLSIGGAALLSGTAIDISASGTSNFGTLNFNATGNVSIQEDSDMVLTGANTGNQIALGSSGSITDAAGTSVAAGGDMSIGAAGAVNLSDQAGDILSAAGHATISGSSIAIDSIGAVNFGTLQFNSSGGVAIAEDSDTVLSGASTADQADLISAGSLTDATGATVAVTNDLSMAAAAAINLNDEASNALTVGGGATLSGTAIAIGSPGAVNFGTLNFNSAGAVDISEDSATVLSGANTANSLSLTSSGGISDAPATTLAVVNGSSLVAGGAISLADNAADQFVVGGLAAFQGTSITLAAAGVVNLGQLNFVATGGVDITEDSEMRLTGVNSAASASLASAGAIGDDPATSITISGNLAMTAAGAVSLADNAGDVLDVGGNASFNGTTIALNSVGTVQLGSLTFNAPGAVFVAEDSATQLSGANTAGSLQLISSGAVTDQAGTSVAVTGAALVQAGGAIVLADSGGDNFAIGGNALLSGGSVAVGTGGAANFGTLTIQTSGSATVVEGSDTTFVGVNNAQSLQVTSAGAITDGAVTTWQVTNQATLSAAAGIQLNDQVGDVLNVGGDATFGGTTIIIGSAGAANFGSLNFNSAGLVAVAEDSATLLRGSNTANGLVVLSAGTIEDAVGTSVVVTGNAFLQSSGTLQLADSATDDLAVSGQASFLTGGNGAVLVGMNPAFQPFDASFAVTNADSGATVNMGAIFFDTANAGDTIRQEVRIREDSGTVLVGLSRASSLYLGTQGSVDDSHVAAINLATPQGGASNLFFDAQGSIRVGETAGISIAGQGTFRSATSSVEIGVVGGTFTDSGQVVQTGGLTVQAPGVVRAVLDSTIQLQFDNFGSSLSLAGTNIFDGASATLDTDGVLQLVSAGNIRLGDGAAVVTLGLGELRTQATNASIELDSSANLGGSSVAGVYHLTATNSANSQLIQTSGLIAANAGAFEASGAVVLRNAALGTVAIDAAGAFSTGGIPLNAVVPAGDLPSEVAALVRNNGGLIVGDVSDPFTLATVSGIQTNDGNVYLETLGAGNDLTIQRPIAAGNADNTILLVAGGQLNLNAPLSRGNPLTDGLVTQVAPEVVVNNPTLFNQVDPVTGLQSVRFSYGVAGELRFTARVDWADGTSFDVYVGNVAGPPAGTIVVAGLQFAHPNGISTIDVTKSTPYDATFLVSNPLLTSTLTITDDTQIQTYSSGGATDLNSAAIDFNANVTDFAPGVPPEAPPPVVLGFVPPEEEEFQEISNPDVRQVEFDDVQAAIGQQDELAKLYSVFLDDPNNPRRDWPEELDIESIKRQILSSPNSVFRPGTYEIIRQKEGQDPEVLETFEKDVDPEKNKDNNAAAPAVDADLGQQRQMPLQDPDASQDASIWIREWETWMAQGNFPQFRDSTEPTDGGEAPQQPMDDVPQVPRFTVAYAALSQTTDIARNDDVAEGESMQDDIPPIAPVSSHSLLVGGAAAILQIHNRWRRQSTGGGSAAPPSSSPECAASAPPAFDQRARRRRRLLG